MRRVSCSALVISPGRPTTLRLSNTHDYTIASPVGGHKGPGRPLKLSEKPVPLIFDLELPSCHTPVYRGVKPFLRLSVSLIPVKKVPSVDITCTCSSAFHRRHTLSARLGYRSLSNPAFLRKLNRRGHRGFTHKAKEKNLLY